MMATEYSKLETVTVVQKQKLCPMAGLHKSCAPACPGDYIL